MTPDHAFQLGYLLGVVVGFVFGFLIRRDWWRDHIGIARKGEKNGG